MLPKWNNTRNSEAMKKKIIPILILIILSVQVSACGAIPQPTTSPAPMTPTPTKFRFSTATKTATSVPAILNPTSKPTSDLRAALSPQEREDYLLEYFENPGECKLPCWLGITPGVTTFSDFQATIEWLGLNYSPRNFNQKSKEHIELGGLDYESKKVLNRITLAVEPGGMISEVEGELHAYLDPVSFATTWDTLDIQQVLLNYGMPSSISIITDTNDVTNRVGYSIRVYYLEKGFAIYYGGGTDYQDEVNICPYLKNYQLITVFFLLQAPLFEEKTNDPQGFYTELDTGLGVSELYTLFTDQNHSCLKVPADKFE